ncbi:hematopoietic prostaglandin D synthase [Folsomia candida]|uniref:glutathione transferase n=1 Tax=Folsomia candida TaxID=158441 RepID=A0A226D1Q4_FOLCA|nr:hematopoietic prostaglandin D synthase [Folsomia candida]OXA38804.1 Glutathione S-transferase [Folsomia candida]
MTSQQETYKLTYFNFRGLAEPIRLMFAYAGVAYTDDRVAQDDTWPAKKSSLPWGTLPVLEVRSGKTGQPFVLAQAVAIGRFLAKKFGLDAKTEEDAAKGDEYVDALKDFQLEFFAWFRAADEEAKAAVIQTIKEKHAPSYFGKFEAILARNKTGWLVGDSLTWVDIFTANHLSNFFKFLSTEDNDISQDYPHLVKLTQRVFALNGISKWIEKRPVTQF